MTVLGMLCLLPCGSVQWALYNGEPSRQWFWILSIEHHLISQKLGPCPGVTSSGTQSLVSLPEHQVLGNSELSPAVLGSIEDPLGQEVVSVG